MRYTQKGELLSLDTYIREVTGAHGQQIYAEKPMSIPSKKHSLVQKF
jgi:hypothetical protein